MRAMDEQMHLAAQYLAVAGMNFVQKKADDSHTNLGFSIAKRCLETHPLSANGDMLSLRYDSFSLHWESPTGSTSFPLDGATHEAIVQWLNHTSERFLSSTYTYGLHYELPYDISEGYSFALHSATRLKELCRLRMFAQSALEETLLALHLESPIRIWPHHFDSGAFAQLNPTVSVGLGMAMPDQVCKEHYFYISAYEGQAALPTAGFASLSQGIWKNNAFTGAVLTAEHITLGDVVSFFKEALAHYSG